MKSDIINTASGQNGTPIENLKIHRIRRLFHGTGQYHEQIDLDLSGDPFQDFGKGYYLTSYRRQARLWAERKRIQNHPCWILEYELRPLFPPQTRVRELLEYNQEWLDFITEHRVYGKDDGAWDIVYDRMADNRYNQLMRSVNAYIHNGITAESAIQRIKPDGGRDQYCFKTERAVSLLNLVHIHTCEGQARQSVK